MMEAQLIETAILNIINHQSLIATKASRVVYAAGGSGVMELSLIHILAEASVRHDD